MGPSDSTSWTVIDGAARGAAEHRDAFAEIYGSVVTTFLRARWRHSELLSEVPDAVQEVLLECFRPGGVVERASHQRPRGFLAYLYGVTRHVASHFESRSDRAPRIASNSFYDAIANDDERLSRLFDKAWARAVIREALHLQEREASSDESKRRFTILRLRFHEGLPVREIAARTGMDPVIAHRQYASARTEFREVLRTTLGRHLDRPGPATDDDLRELRALAD